MNPPANEPREFGFAIGLLTGVCIGVALAMRLAPLARAEMQGSRTDSARRLRHLASDMRLESES
jgi:gas vesicle protein